MLCPGFARARIAESGRNRRDRYPTRSASARAPEIPISYNQSAGCRWLSAIREEQLYVFTHTSALARLAEDRFATIPATMDKAAARQSRGPSTILELSELSASLRRVVHEEIAFNFRSSSLRSPERAWRNAEVLAEAPRKMALI
jgi:hypothetical protein